MDRASSYMGSDKVTVEEHLGVFSNDGLRTLLLGKKEMTKARKTGRRGGGGGPTEA